VQRAVSVTRTRQAINNRTSIRSPARGVGTHIDIITIDNVPNLNADEPSAYALVKHLLGISDNKIRESIIMMLKEDG
jgi:hypothetical protein